MSGGRVRLASIRVRSTWTATLVATHLCACTTAPPPAATVSEAQRGRMGAVGVASLATIPQGELAVGTRGTGAGAAEGAAAGAAGGALMTVAQMGAACVGAGVIVCVVVLPIAAVGGAIYGAAVGARDAVPEDRAAEMEARLRTVLAEVGQQERLRAEVAGAASRAGVRRVTEVDGAAAGPVGSGQADYRKLADAKVDTILEVGLVSVVLAGKGGSDPTLVFRVGAVARLVDARTGAELYHSRAFTFEAEPRKYSEWTADGSRALKDELARAYRTLAGSMVDEIFLVVRTN